MNTVKYRAWMPKEKKWYKGGAIQLTAMQGNTFGLSEANGKTIQLQQWTGLTDRHGVEIYEGDIVLFEDTLFSVEWNVNGSWCYMRHPKPFLTQIRYWESEVIGNIYENPELIK